MDRREEAKRSENTSEIIIESSAKSNKYENSFAAITVADVPRGKILRNLEYYSDVLKKKMAYHVYLPFGYERNKSYNFIYVLDGSEYLKNANINLIADYAIHKEDIPESVIILIDPSEKSKEYKIFEPYRNYVINEMLEVVEGKYGHEQSKLRNTIIGVSSGGLTAIYLAVSMPHRFNRVLSQSGSFWPANWLIYDMLQESERNDIVFCLQTGTINDTEEMNDMMYKILASHGYRVNYLKFEEGHTWDNWREHLYEGLLSLYQGWKSH